MEKIIELKNINFSYGKSKTIDDVNLEIGKGIYGLLGPNGAGKTTLMKIILGFLPSASGSGRILGHDIKESHIEVRKKVGYMPESDCLIPGMDAVTLTAYLGELSGMPKQEAVKRAHEVLYYVGLEESRYRMADTYSSGMKQRLKLAQALVHDPELLFLDEPTSGMDPQGRKAILDLINDIASKEKMNIIISSHILADIEHTCRHVLIMNKGRIVSNQMISGLDRSSFDKFGMRISGKNGEKDRAIELKLKGNVEEFAQKMATMGVEKPERDEKGYYSLCLPAAVSSGTFFKTARECGVQVRHFKESRLTLEDTFVTAIGEDNAG